MNDDFKKFSGRLLLAAALFVAIAFLWQISGVLLLVFGAILFAVILRAMAAPIHKYAKLPESVALPTAGLMLLGVIGLMGWLFSSIIGDQIADLHQSLPPAWDKFKSWLAESAMGRYALDHAGNFTPGNGLASRFSAAAFSVLGGLTNLVLVLMGGIYLAVQPKLYRNGALKLLPEKARPNVGETLTLTGNALRLWLIGQLLSMTALGLLITLGLWLVGVPSPAALGLLAGLGEFIPLLGAVLAIIPALLLAFSSGMDTVWWTIGVFIVIQQFHGNVLMPLIQRNVVFLPPALSLFSIVIFTILFGLLGMLFAAPLTVVLFVIVKKLYIRDTLGDETKIPGEQDA